MTADCSVKASFEPAIIKQFYHSVNAYICGLILIRMKKVQTGNFYISYFEYYNFALDTLGIGVSIIPFC
jgi:hypothetical protein